MKKLNLLREASLSTISLHTPIGEGDTIELWEMIPDERAQDPSEALSEVDMHRQFDDELLSVLDTRER